jgi:hypothetical protein
LTSTLTKWGRIGLSGIRSFQRPVGDAIVVYDLPLLLKAQDLVELDALDWDEGRAGVSGFNRKARVMGRQIDLADEGVGRLDAGYAGKLQFLRQPVLKRLERALRSASRLGRSEERPSRDGLCGEKAPICSTPSWPSALPTWVGEPRSISPALVARK